MPAIAGLGLVLAVLALAVVAVVAVVRRWTAELGAALAVAVAGRSPPVNVRVSQNRQPAFR